MKRRNFLRSLFGALVAAWLAKDLGAVEIEPVPVQSYSFTISVNWWSLDIPTSSRSEYTFTYTETGESEWERLDVEEARINSEEEKTLRGL